MHINIGDTMSYYFKVLIFYSFLGFIYESDIFKISSSSKHSGILFGPLTLVYGFGCIALILLNKYLFNNIKATKYLKIFIMYIIITISLSIIEYLGGNILHLIFNIDMWNYSNHYLHLGKYICLFNSLIWGIFGLLFIYILHPRLNKIINNITTRETYIILVIFIIDVIATMLTKLN